MRRMGVIIVESDDERQHDFGGGNKLSFFRRSEFISFAIATQGGSEQVPVIGIELPGGAKRRG